MRPPCSDVERALSALVGAMVKVEGVGCLLWRAWVNVGSTRGRQRWRPCGQSSCWRDRGMRGRRGCMAPLVFSDWQAMRALAAMVLVRSTGSGDNRIFSGPTARSRGIVGLGTSSPCIYPSFVSIRVSNIIFSFFLLRSQPYRLVCRGRASKGSRRNFGGPVARLRGIVGRSWYVLSLYLY